MSNFGGYQAGMTLKELLEIPNLQNPLLNFDGSKKNGNESPPIDMAAAFLGPNLWDKTYDMEDFKLEYMDLDEFLSENGIPLSQEETTPCAGGRHNKPDVNNVIHDHVGGGHLTQLGHLEQSPLQQHSPPGPGCRLGEQSPLHVPHTPSPAVQSPQGHSLHVTNSPQSVSPPCSPAYSPAYSSSGSEGSPHEHGKSQVNFPDNDMALTRLPGQRNFDPCKHQFTDDDLKPQPMIKKSKKIFVPDNAKDDKYWCRRKKNNVAAKRSRDARRIKENQIAMRASYLERENFSMKQELEKLRRENLGLKTSLSKYEKS